MGKSKLPGPAAQGIAAYQHTLRKLRGSKNKNGGGDAEMPGAVEAPPSSPGLIKTGKAKTRPPAFAPRPIPADTAGVSRDPPQGDSRVRRAAKFLILIGGDEAARILAHLDIEQVEAISREIASIRGIDAGEAGAVLGEFRSLLSAPYTCAGSASGGVEAARRLLYAAFGPEKGENLLNRTLPETRENPFAFLEDFSGEQTGLLLKEEAPMTAALVLSRLSPRLCAAVLANTVPERKLEIVRRLAHLGPVSPEVMEQIASALKEKARHISAAVSGDSVEIDGRNALAAILKSSDLSFGDRILEELENMDEALSRDLKGRLHTLEDVVKANDRPLQEKLRSMSERDIALLLKGRSGAFTEKIMANVSSHRRTLIREEHEILGAVPRRDADKAAEDFLAWFRLNREEGRILLVSDEDVVM
ncbi:MAG: flagellar motor switch protein FliG [Treponema sp.]|nr:flagellar motor switch protein FliG [Treponema sp.]